MGKSYRLVGIKVQAQGDKVMVSGIAESPRGTRVPVHTVTLQRGELAGLNRASVLEAAISRALGRTAD